MQTPINKDVLTTLAGLETTTGRQLRALRVGARNKCAMARDLRGQVWTGERAICQLGSANYTTARHSSAGASIR